MSGEYEIYIQRQDGSADPVPVTSGGKTYIYNILWSPDSKKIAWTDRLGNLKFVNIDSKKVKLV